MRLLKHLPLLASMIFAVLVPMFIGHGLAGGGAIWIVAACAVLLVAAAATFVTLRVDRSRADEVGSTRIDR